MFTALLSLGAAPVHAQCQLCASPGGATTALPAQRALTIEIEVGLDFSRAAHLSQNGGGNIAVDERTGARTVRGALADLGGMAFRGVVRLSGQPFARVGVTLPTKITLVASDGSTADVMNVRSDLPADPQLDANGQLRFGIGGRLIVSGGVAGDFRGRVPITAEYR